MIYKYNLTADPKIMLANNAEILSIQLQHGDVTLWADTDPKQEQVEYTFFSIMTGQEVPKGLVYITTLQSADGMFVQHIYRKFITKDLAKSFF